MTHEPTVACYRRLRMFKAGGVAQLVMCHPGLVGKRSKPAGSGGGGTAKKAKKKGKGAKTKANKRKRGT